MCRYVCVDLGVTAGVDVAADTASLAETRVVVLFLSDAFRHDSASCVAAYEVPFTCRHYSTITCNVQVTFYLVSGIGGLVKCYI